MAAKLGQLLITSQIITEEQLKEAIGLQRREGGRLGTSLVKLGHITEDKLVAFLSKQWGVPAINLSDYKIDPLILKLIPIEIARKYLIVPVARVGATLTIAMADPSNVFVIDDVKFMTGYNVDVVVSSESSILHAISAYYRSDGDALIPAKKEAAKSISVKDYTFQEVDLKEEENSTFDEVATVDVDEFDRVVGDALDSIETYSEKDESAGAEIEEPIVKLVNGILINAIKDGASDIHIEPYEKSLRVRYRVDGVLFNAMNLPLKIKNPITSRLKIMSKLDIAERRLPQDGRIKLRLSKKKAIKQTFRWISLSSGSKKVC
jgi:type IV pilus assembly protein PilB